MIVILTHERADFDAVASQVGLARLIPGAVPVKPQAINANVRRFLAEHAADLALSEREVGRGEKIVLAWYVDTQAAADVPGMRPNTPRAVLDHHVLEGRGGEAWIERHVEDTGACATLVVERLRDADLALSSAEASLLMLGVHEDTGSLRYATTTDRDARALAWLIEQGAELDLLPRYLSPRLDSESLRLLAELTASVEMLTRHGRAIAVAAADASEFGGELSLLARPVMESQAADAAAILVALPGHVQLVARSACDEIDVGALARAMGGGGHARAAAAVVERPATQDVPAGRGRPALAEARSMAIELLRQGVADGAVPSVADIMTHGSLVTASLDMTVSQVLAMAARHGHEGFPVLDDGNLLGVIARRDLDLAAHHGMLELPLRNLVAGEPPSVTASAAVDDALLTMRRRRTGQLPVVDGDSVVGIVTRTDVLAHLASRAEGESGSPQRLPLGAKLAPSIAAALREIARIAEDLGFRVYLVGGIPRDLALGRDIRADIDLLVEGEAPRLGREVKAALGGRLTVHERFGTATWAREGLAIDLVTARAEYYESPGQLPVVQAGSLRSDLRRRDFTMNTLALEVAGERFGLVVDPMGAIEDIWAGVLRVIHPLSFVEDPTRILRAARFEARLGFSMDDFTERLAREAAAGLRDMSGARIAGELRKTLSESDPVAPLERLEELGALAAIHPALGFGPAAATLLRSLVSARESTDEPEVAAPLAELEPEWAGMVLWLGSLEAGSRIASRLRLPGREREAIEQFADLMSDRVPTDPDVEASRLDGALGGFDRRIMALAWLALADRERRFNVVRALQLRSRPGLPIDGHDLQAMGLPPGPEYAGILADVRSAWLDGRLLDRAAALEMARRLAGPHQDQDAPAGGPARDQRGDGTDDEHVDEEAVGPAAADSSDGAGSDGQETGDGL